MTEEQMRFVLALLNVAIEMDRSMGMDEWLGDGEFENWTPPQTQEIIKIIEEANAK